MPRWPVRSGRPATDIVEFSPARVPSDRAGMLGGLREPFSGRQHDLNPKAIAPFSASPTTFGLSFKPTTPRRALIDAVYRAL